MGKANNQHPIKSQGFFIGKMSKTLLTQQGFERLSQELADLKDKQVRLVVQLEEVAQPDESGEDGLATQLKEELEVVNDRIDNITQTLDSAKIINGQNTQNGCVQVGCTVKIKISGRHEKIFQIVNHMEANPDDNKISDQSPLGLALIGKKVRDTFDVEAPVGKITYQIVSIK